MKTSLKKDNKTKNQPRKGNTSSREALTSTSRTGGRGGEGFDSNFNFHSSTCEKYNFKFEIILDIPHKDVIRFQNP